MLSLTRIACTEDSPVDTNLYDLFSVLLQDCHNMGFALKLSVIMIKNWKLNHEILTPGVKEMVTIYTEVSQVHNKI